jgi:hypothetical protein
MVIMCIELADENETRDILSNSDLLERLNKGSSEHHFLRRK